MSASSKRKLTVSKAGVIEEVVAPLMKHLEIANEQVAARDPKIKDMFKEIKWKVERQHDIFGKRKEREADLIDKFGAIERHIDNILEDEECEPITELKFIGKIIDAFDHGIVVGVITPLMKHLERVEEQIASQRSSDPKIKEMFEEIKGMFEQVKDIFNKTKKWDSDLMNRFITMERHVDKIFDDNKCDTNNELEAISRELKELKEMVQKSTPPEELCEVASLTHVVKSQSSNYENGESSKARTAEQEEEQIEDGYIIFMDEIIEKLNPQMRHAFYCLSLFPEESVIKRRLLVYFWIGLKVLWPEKGQTVEQVGNVFFEDLVNKGILIPLMKRKHNNIVDQCMIHPIFYKTLSHSARRKKFIIDNDENSKDGTLHLCSNRQNKSEVYTVLNVKEEYLISGVISSSLVDRKAAVIQLGQWRCVDQHHIEVDQTDFLKDLGPDLTYLSLQGISRIPELPEPIGNSTGLMILDLRACHNLEKLPPKIKSWKNLTHLDVSMCYLLDHIPRWISMLSNLEVFKGFVIGSSRNKNRCRLGDISGLRKLRKLSINIGRDSEVISDEESNSLKDLTMLLSLTLTWGIDTEENGPENNPAEHGQKSKITFIENFSPPKNLEKLDLICFPYARAPQWLTPTKLKKLKRLYIRGGKLAAVGSSNPDSTWVVETLRLRFLKNFEIEWSDLHSLFPKINYVEHLKCDKLKNFPKTEDEFWFK